MMQSRVFCDVRDVILHAVLLVLDGLLGIQSLGLKSRDR